ncbi:ADP-ribosylation [Ophiobolus disseminans]|uniref:ADP-ribosylation n=1 Tax=Ophiobolus disseminans TaxID=1469910 RepID=A0A6A7AAV4_9PLEO|nr:ADP-ribosylation [Ophiobolus disseminans]
MFGHTQIVHLATFLALLSPALATVYRVDDRSPQQIREAGGFKARDPTGTGTVIEHVRKTLGDKDPWVSTTSSEDFAQAGAKSNLQAYIYHISENGIKLVDTKKAFDEAREVHPHPGEFEMSVKGEITWDSIKKWDVYKRGKKESDQSRDDFEDGQEDKKRSAPLVRSVKFRA